MLIVADENIPLLDSFFGDIGDIRPVSGRTMTAADVQNADILLVRSVTRVNRALLEGSRVRFVGTCTIGTDHVDLEWLESSGIAFSAAPGCNANSVVEYVLSVISLHAERRGVADWSKLSVGIVGAGNVGGELAHKLDRLGFDVLLCDPPRAEREGDEGQEFASLSEVMACDVVTLHTPLSREGGHATLHMFDQEKLSALREHQLLINTSRGEVIDTSALLARLDEPNAPTVVLDVWEHEPRIHTELLDRVWLATPHIAGYSLEGKVQGSELVYQALSRNMGLPVRKKAGQFLPEPALSKLSFTSAAVEMDSANIAMRSCYDPRRDDARMRLAMALPAEERGQAFDRLRREYPVRREFSSVKIQLKGTSKSMQDTFRALGFKLKL
ncbi:4-phosphoerythronate dehydrogenase PdxB [Marinobacter sp. TBZ242]|uniref:Erythronate-4-phosphate dehydrogenase n=1 Tax=Marinobacter azerbaijanicus TaxID=3050455 RepID=A0ABT7I6T4_9GAMM|nr:4-phosphoerythronate dehydrogenase PdxB [Marinobacter sp. TBZ242]MDL0429861.1 4-phosphoerythronate dehydrogenase PdxB [Marinobacter sp. TBZ242]